MRRIFADSVYWIAVLNARDQGHARAVVPSKTLQPAQIITTDEVLTEFLNDFAEWAKSQSVLLSGSGVDPQTRPTSAYQHTKGQVSLTIADGKVVGAAYTGRGASGWPPVRPRR